MAKRGRKRKPGPRTRSGQLSRAVPRIDRGSERAQRMHALYGTNGSDAIGRAFERGLMGGGSEAKAMLDTARAIHRLYWAWYINGAVRSPLGERNGQHVEHDEERAAKQEAWLGTMLAIAGGQGHAARVIFDQLVIDVNPDEGPAWLDRILAARAEYVAAMDWSRLSTALDLLADCAGVRRGR